MTTVVFLALLVLFAVVPVVFSWTTFVFTMALAAGFAALGVGLMLRAGLISLGHAMFFALGAYTVAMLQGVAGVHDLLLLRVAATVFCTAVGAVVGAFMVRYRAIFFAMLNLAASMVFFALLSKLYAVTGGTDGMSVPTPSLLGMTLDRVSFNYVLFYGSLALAFAVCGMVRRFMKSPLGEALAAVESNEIRLQYLGIPVQRVLLAAYTMSAALAGVGGALAAIAIGRVLPEMSYWTESGEILLMAVLGGTAGPIGPFLGAIFLSVVRTAAAGYAADIWNLIIGSALLVVIFFLPGGLYGIGQRLLRKQERA